MHDFSIYSSAAHEIKSYLQDKLKSKIISDMVPLSTSDDTISASLSTILVPQKFEKINLLLNYPDLSTYVKGNKLFFFFVN